MATETARAPQHARTEPRQTPRPPRFKTALGLCRLAWFLLTHPSAPVPVPHMNVRVPRGPWEQQLDFLKDVMDAYHGDAEKRRGCVVAERRFGPVTVEAHVNTPDYTRQIAMLRDGAAGNEVMA